MGIPFEDSAKLGEFVRIGAHFFVCQEEEELGLAGKEFSRHGLAGVGIIGVRLVLVAAVLQTAAIRAKRVGDTLDRAEVGSIAYFDIARAVAASLENVGGLASGHVRRCWG